MLLDTLPPCIKEEHSEPELVPQSQVIMANAVRSNTNNITV